ncbi:hypothetical protein FB451DRAFT_1556392 [Mycena latifolia]|nr:hypothetical protein FB451DRAFT_1556392 [Mycena latifolia]
MERRLCPRSPIKIPRSTDSLLSSPKAGTTPSAVAHPLSQPHRHAVSRPPRPRHLLPDPRDLCRTRARLEQGPPHS